MQNTQKLLYFVITTVFIFLLVIVAFLTSTRSFKTAGDDNFREDITNATPFIENETGVRYIDSDCKISGCSGQLCIDASEEDAITTCEYKDEYACYKTAICEKQESGTCGWQDTVELKNCLESPPTSIPTSTEPYL